MSTTTVSPVVQTIANQVRAFGIKNTLGPVIAIDDKTAMIGYKTPKALVKTTIELEPRDTYTVCVMKINNDVRSDQFGEIVKDVTYWGIYFDQLADVCGKV